MATKSKESEASRRTVLNRDKSSDYSGCESASELKDILLPSCNSDSSDCSTIIKVKCEKDSMDRSSHSIMKKVNTDHTQHESILKKIISIPVLESEAELTSICPKWSSSNMVQKTKGTGRSSHPILRKVKDADHTECGTILKKSQTKTKGKDRRPTANSILKNIKSTNHSGQKSTSKKLKCSQFQKSGAKSKNISPTHSRCNMVKKDRQQSSRTGLKKVKSIDGAENVRCKLCRTSELEFGEILPLASFSRSTIIRKAKKKRPKHVILKRINSADFETCCHNLRCTPFHRSEVELKTVLPQRSASRSTIKISKQI
ncbi:uncharacterized protein LOC111349415 [Spodoptera litura]|uniref:Uncharacterized protein LOC111349415 n=1 Tax=Spodoptera litura TaxID=69820 RepID=A0A9J7DQM3_SPOLT|nr:uncharacterized protein LOC111349415 [Spodoptera litura]